MSSEPIPIYGQGFFYVHRSGLVDQLIVFDYWDRSGYYERVLANREEYEAEVESLAENMQYYLDQERVSINGVRARPTVTGVEIGLRGRPELAYIVFTIEFRGEVRPGLNVYENVYEEEEAEYEYAVYWFFPERSRVVSVEVGVPYRVDRSGRVLFFRVKPGTIVGGREAIQFEVEG